MRETQQMGFFQQPVKFRKLKSLNHYVRNGIFSIVGAKVAFNMSDTQAGYRFITAKALQGLPLRAVGYQMELELLLKACKRGHSVVDISVATQYSNRKPSSHLRLVMNS